MKIRVENWMGHDIRFVELTTDDWWAVAKDVATALGYSIAPHMVRLIDSDEKDAIHLTDSIGRNQKMTVISETGIYEAIFNSGRQEAREFKKWVKSLLKQLRKNSGLEGFQIFRTLDKDHQKEAMKRLCDNLRDPKVPNFAKANTITNKAVSTKFGHPKLIKKEQMTPEMLIARQEILDDTVNLMTMADKFRLDFSISQTIYGKYLGDEQRNREAN
ncbi:BRO family protein [Paenibacillus sp. FSL P4-0176]|uniref:BRO-N domain-containing protein n=1 Tax=Paenibacillus sp. FSL P4-0176 TaxID=2921631 RepID=UPI0030CD238A